MTPPTLRQITRRDSLHTLSLAQYHPVLQRVLRARPVEHEDALQYQLTHLLAPSLLSHIQTASARLAEAIKHQQRILIVADFDADGATSCALMYRALHMMGAQHVDFLVPNRFEYGYGLTPEIVAEAAKRHPQLMITVDNGIASIAGALATKQYGIDLIITDHHLPSDEQPHAVAVVNPNQRGCHFPSKSLAGVGVAFYVMLGLRQVLREQGYFTDREPNLASLLDLVAFGTVADVVPLDYNNRILVAQGLRRIQQGACVVGISALAQVSGRSLDTLTASDIGFGLAPRLNAAGRLDDMSRGIACLLTDDATLAHHIASQLDALNQERRDIESSMLQEAETALNQLQLDQQLPAAIALFDASWHQGVIGILASRLKDRTHRPVFVFAEDHTGHLRGSGRSIAGLHLRDILEAIALRHPQMIVHFGGHAMAAGLTLPAPHFDAFALCFAEVVAQYTESLLTPDIILSDGPLTAEDFTLQLADTIRQAGPWGQHFAEPLFDNQFEVLDAKILKNAHLKLSLKLNHIVLEGIAFNQANRWHPTMQHIHAAYRLDINHWRGAQRLQLLIEYFE